MIARLGQALALLVMCLPSAAIAQEWRCRDTITFAGGWSVMDQLYLDRSSAETPPLFHVSTAGFYANWYPVLAAIDAPFTAPGLLSFELKVPVGIEPATGEFVAPGATALTATVTASNTRTGRVLFQTREPALNAALLRQKDWTVYLNDRSGQRVAKVYYRFPLGFDELRAFHLRHVASIKAMAEDRAARCGEQPDNSVIF